MAIFKTLNSIPQPIFKLGLPNHLSSLLKCLDHIECRRSINHFGTALGLLAIEFPLHESDLTRCARTALEAVITGLKAILWQVARLRIYTLSRCLAVPLVFDERSKGA